MERTVPAVYEHGALTPLEPLDLPEHQRVIITIHAPILESPDETLKASQRGGRGGLTLEACRKNRRL